MALSSRVTAQVGCNGLQYHQRLEAAAGGVEKGPREHTARMRHPATSLNILLFVYSYHLHVPLM